MFCSQCGELIAEGDLFCTNCGKPVPLGEGEPFGKTPIGIADDGGPTGKKPVGIAVAIAAAAVVAVTLFLAVPVFLGEGADGSKDSSSAEVSDASSAKTRDVTEGQQGDRAHERDDHDASQGVPGESQLGSDDPFPSAGSSQSVPKPFWGVWMTASKDESVAQQAADELRDLGYEGARVVLTTDWSNLNDEPWYVVTAGHYATEAEAKSVVAALQSSGHPDAYAKYSGDYARADDLGTQYQTIHLQRYGNARFGFTVSLPSWYVWTESDNGDGVTAKGLYPDMTIYAYGSYNATGDTAKSLLAIDAEARDLSYSASEGNWYVASWVQGDEVVYRKIYVSSDRCCAVEFIYPPSSEGDEMVESVIETFDPGF